VYTLKTKVKKDDHVPLFKVCRARRRHFFDLGNGGTSNELNAVAAAAKIKEVRSPVTDPNFHQYKPPRG